MKMSITTSTGEETRWEYLGEAPRTSHSRRVKVRCLDCGKICDRIWDEISKGASLACKDCRKGKGNKRAEEYLHVCKNGIFVGRELPRTRGQAGQIYRTFQVMCGKCERITIRRTHGLFRACKWCWKKLRPYESMYKTLLKHSARREKEWAERNGSPSGGRFVVGVSYEEFAAWVIAFPLCVDCGVDVGRIPNQIGAGEQRERSRAYRIHRPNAGRGYWPNNMQTMCWDCHKRK